ncbi:annexin [Histoplasma capsulatum var. duboisii H88]|uniref:Annexin n=1 Tax=Ajellomyces capsulatus (strain H88) TaxID=544711 RepID=F0U863_AJEC8|nr:annexin [Histoplasma capsulatum var. duboisii H88]QSS51898.1 annexin [Histoplasma capsulatum var. duboisii H88]
MASLRVHDSRPRTRSKSPSGRIREHSRSRETRAPSPPREKTGRSSKKYYHPDSEEETLYASSRSSRKYYDYHAEDDKYRHSEKPNRQYQPHPQPQPPGYYMSDEEEGPRKRTSTAEPPKSYKYRYDSDRNRRHSRTQSSNPSKYESYSDDSVTDSEDDALAYGDGPYTPSAPSYERLREKYTSSAKQPDSDSTGGSLKYGRALAKLRGEESPNHPSRRDYDSREHPSYAKPETYRYAQPSELRQNHPDDPGARQYGSKHQNTVDWAEVPECERPGFVPPPEFNNPVTSAQRPKPIPATTYSTVDPSHVPHAPIPPNQYPSTSHAGYNAQQYANMPIPRSSGAGPLPTATIPTDSGHQRQYSTEEAPDPHQYYAQPAQFQYAQPDHNIKYVSKSTKPYTQSSKNQFVKPYSQVPDPTYVEIKPKKSAERPHGLSISTSNGHMALPGSFPDASRPPASPLLEAYKGTYQSISPMPWPTSVPSYLDEGLSDLEPLDSGAISGSELGRSRKSKSTKDDDSSKTKSKSSMLGADIKLIAPANVKKKVSFYDPKPDAKELKASLRHSHVDPKPLIDVLPYLSSDDLLALRTEYKNIAKVGGKGINIAKQIKVQVPGNFGKVCYATALGRWESEAHWANFWYRSNSLRRELLIESLIGRTNAEIREIKKCFRDKRYGDDLEKCMKAELRADKFRAAILLALEERRQSNSAPLDKTLVRDDMRDLHRALISREGGETAMIQIIIVRGDTHLREVLHVYEDTYHKNFAKEMITKSQNLVGETLVHVLNGALNRPMRDALLLHQAISESGTGRERAELLISRLVRMHWEPNHLEHVKSEYKRRYKQSVEDAIDREVINGVHKDWAEFCIGLVKSSRVHIANGTA